MITRDYIDYIIKNFKTNPTLDSYNIVKDWYYQNINIVDKDYLDCVHLFILGCNIRYKYVEYDNDKHMEWIRNINSTLYNSKDRNSELTKKCYLNYGIK